jgi:hypothetical protein
VAVRSANERLFAERKATSPAPPIAERIPKQMAQGTAQTDRPSSAAARAAKVIEYERYIDEQVGKTRTNVKLVELAGQAMTLAAAVFGFLLVAAVLDHWIVPGGLGFRSRLLLLLCLAVGAIWYVAARAVPLLIKRINPEYAAQTIENSATSLKNSLLNFLMLRHNPAGIRPGVYEVIEEQAATRLASVPVESAVDRTHLIHVGYLLLGIVVIGCLYKVISPKDPLVTAERVILPWADIAPPTRVQILAVQPGATTVSRGTQVTVSADVRGAESDEPVRLFYTTAGQQVVDHQVEMHMPTGQSRYACLLGAREVGVREDLSYRIEAGDAISRTFRIRVTPAPTILVERIDYAYPPYTGLSKQTVQREGDISAIEGTRVTIHTRANGLIDTARIDFDCDGRSDRRMKVSGDRATASFLLALTPAQNDPSDQATGGSPKRRSDAVSVASPRVPRRRTYQVLFVNEAGQENLRPIEYQLEVTPDLRPEVELLAPAENELDVPLDGSVEVEARANDPDFALRQVVFHAAVGPRNVWQKSLLDKVQTGQLVGRLRFEPGRYGVKVGDLVEIWAVARDNKMPEPNVRETQRKRLRIVPPEHGQAEPGVRPQEADQPNARPNDRQDPSQSSDDGQQSGEAGQQDEAGQQGDQADDEAGGSEGGQQSAAESDGGGQEGEGQSEGGGSGDKSQGQGQSGEGQGESSEGQQGAGESADGQSSGAAAGAEDGAAGQSGGEGGQGEGGQAKSSQGKAQSGSESSDGQGSAAGQAGRSGSPAGQQPGDSQAADQGVPSDGTDDGSAFDEMLKRIQQGPAGAGQGPGQDGQGSESSGAPADQSSDESASGNSAAQKAAGPDGREPAGAATGDGQGDDSQSGRQDSQQPHGAGTGERQAKQGSQRQDGEGQGSERQGDADRTTSGQSAGQEQGRGEEGGKAGAKRPSEANGRPDETPREAESPQAERQRPQDRGAESGDPSGGVPPDPAGSAGSGQQGGAPPKPQTEIGPRDKGAESPNSQPDKGDQAAESSAQGKSESDSQGEGGSDRPGGGEAGGGQQSDRQGTGSAGQNTPADQGAGQAGEKGRGEPSSSAGQSAASDRPTGSPGDQQPGQGSRRGAASPDGKTSPGGKTGQPPPGSKAGQPGSPSQGASGAAGGQGEPSSGGQRGSASPPRSPPAPPPPGDQVNLQYAKKATGLVLQRLKDQIDKDQVDQGMLDKLGWNREDLLRFVKRWDKMYQDAQRPGKQSAAAQQELDDALRSLGLKRDRIFQRAGRRDDSLRQMRESFRSSPPREYQHQLRAYLKGTSRLAVPAADERSR